MTNAGGTKRAELSDRATYPASRRRKRLAFAVIVADFLLVALWLAAHLNLYIDELYSLHTTNRTFAFALGQSLGFEQQPPLFFLALTAWRQISHGDFFARLFSIGCSVATLFVVRAFSQRRLPTIPDWLPPLAIAINPFFLWAAVDIRVYASIILIDAALLYTFFDAFVDRRFSLAKASAFTIVAVAALYTQYFIGFLLVGLGCSLLVLRERQKVVPFVLSMMVVGVACLPLFAVVRGEFHDATVVPTAPVPLAARMLGSIVTFIYPHPKLSDVPTLVKAGYIAIVLLSLIAVFRAGNDRTTQKTFLVLLTSTAVIIAFFLAVILVARAPLEMPRHITTLFLPTALLALAAIAHAMRSNPRPLLATYVVVLALFALGQDAVTYRLPLSNTGDWERVVKYLNARVQPSEPIAVFDTENALPIRHYYHGEARVVPIPHEQSFQVFDRRQFAVRSPAELASAFPTPSPITHRVWLVSGFSTCRMVEMGTSCSVLDAYLAQHFRTVDQRHFNGTDVFELLAK